MYQRFLPLPVIEETHFRCSKLTQIKNGAGGRFSYLGVGKIFDIYVNNMKTSNVKAIDSSNTSCSFLVAWFQTAILSVTTFFWRGVGWEEGDVGLRRVLD